MSLLFLTLLRTFFSGGAINLSARTDDELHHHRLIDTPISTPSSIWEKYRTSRTSWGINVLGSFLVEIEASDGTVGFATGFGGS